MDNICILISTYNGHLYLDEQLESLYQLEHSKIRIVIRDDGSDDQTQLIIEKWANILDISLTKGTNVGWRKSFMELIYNSPESDYYAFCDQDDIWLPNKLQVAIQKLKTMPQGQPNLYCSNLRYYKKGQDLGLVKQVEPRLTLQLSLMRSLAAGCTMVFNKELRDLICVYRPTKVAAHDFWTYQVASLLGNVFYDMNSYILYRQHENNQIGSTRGFWNELKRKYNSGRKNFNSTDRRDAAKELLRLYGRFITADKKKIVEKVANADRSILDRLSLFTDNSYTMGGLSSDIWLKLRILFGHI